MVREKMDKLARAAYFRDLHNRKIELSKKLKNKPRMRSIHKPLRLPSDWVGPWESLKKRKQVFLPDFTITLIRTPFLPPRYASFYVPLNFTKLDIRDYLKRAYGVKTLRVRSYVEQQKITRVSKDGLSHGRLRRPKSRKKMTVELVEPFVWPDPPEDYSPWDRDIFLNNRKWQDEYRDVRGQDSFKKPNPTARTTFTEAAKEILDGKKVWRPTWQALGLNYDRTSVANRFGGNGSDSKSESNSSSSG
ncbi:hypothetical protein PHISCL_04085 [Aspergillus sclerotialis]|uniref:Large ribosomal subunit protein uL23m n=1 Tax=Aspergillus sclerotialis TaxID=2070753 RepID=A0A3A3A0B4_9EURO|nr:hypothetical protein PHISCL_04085 [Aspergillus sclerotialis]